MSADVVPHFREKRITLEEAFSVFNDASLIDLAIMADECRFRLNPENTVTYVLDRNINYTNICESGCSFCAYYVPPGDKRGYVLTRKELSAKIDATLKAGGNQILLQGGLNPELDLGWYEDTFRFIKENFEIHLHALSPPEIFYVARKEGLDFEDVLQRLLEAGLDSIPGGGAEILSHNVRSIVSPNKCSVDDWIGIMRTAHGLGVRTTATMMFGHVENVRDRMEHLERIRNLQDETGGFTAFIPWAFQPSNTRLGGDKTTALDYLRTLAVSRIYLDNIQHLQVSWVTQGSKIAQVALSYGADDFGSLMMEENVVRAAGVEFRMNEEEIVRNIEDANFKPLRRDMYYNIIGEPLCHCR